MRRLRIVWPLALVALASACAVGPDYERPPVEVPVEYRGEAPVDPTVAPEEAPALADLPWWEVFGDPVLQELIREGLAANHDLRIAVERVEQTRASVGVARSSFYPGVTYEGEAARQRRPKQNEVPADTFNTFFGGLAVAWEIDVWGRIRRSSETAENAYLATEQAKRGVLLSLVTTLAQSYLTLIELDRELEIARETEQTFDETLELFVQRYEGGISNKLATYRAEAALAETRAQIPEIERLIAIQENAIGVLLGRNPGPIPRGQPLVELGVPETVPVGLPSELLIRRPDVQQAEYEMASANARIGVAKADFFPRIGLTALYGGQSTELDEIAKGRFNIWNVVGNTVGPLFQGFRLYEQYKGTEAFWRETLAGYEQTLVRAFAEVANTLSDREKLREVREAQELAVLAYEESVELSLLRYRSGLAGYYEVLESQQLLFPAEISLAQAQLRQLLAYVDLYRVLGGGWNLDDAEWIAGREMPEAEVTGEPSDPD